MLIVPALTPVTTPVDASTVPMASLLLLHVPPPGVLDSVDVAPTHAFAVPVMLDGNEFTVMSFVTIQPAPRL